MRESLFYDVPNSTGWINRAIKAWKSIHFEGGKYFGKKDPTTYAPYIQWIKEINKNHRWPFSIEKPLYP